MYRNIVTFFMVVPPLPITFLWNCLKIGTSTRKLAAICGMKWPVNFFRLLTTPLRNFGKITIKKKTVPFCSFTCQIFNKQLLLLSECRLFYRILCFEIRTEKLQLQHAMKKKGYSSNFYILGILSRKERRLLIFKFCLCFSVLPRKAFIYKCPLQPQMDVGC